MIYIGYITDIIFKLNMKTIIYIDKLFNNMEQRKFIATTLCEYLIEQVLSSDNIENFTRMSKFVNRRKYADENFKLINKGTGRYVYNINDEFVLKLAKNKKGLEQNKTEINISKSGKYNDITANIVEYNDEGLYLIQQKAYRITENRFKDITGLQLQGFLYYIRHNKDWDGDNVKFYNKVNSLVDSFQLDRFDIANENSWGIINGNVVIVDYGLDMNTARKLYGVKY